MMSCLTMYDITALSMHCLILCLDVHYLIKFPLLTMEVVLYTEKMERKVHLFNKSYVGSSSLQGSQTFYHSSLSDAAILTSAVTCVVIVLRSHF